MLFDTDEFIRSIITKRKESFFKEDLLNNQEELSYRIKGKSIMVIGGAGTIGSSFIKAILPFQPGKLLSLIHI